MIDFNLGILADNAHVDSGGKLYVLGEFRYIFAPSLPARHGHLAVVARWIADIDSIAEPQMLEVDLVEADGAPVIPRSPQMPLQFAPVGPAERGKAQAQLIMNMDRVIIHKYGDYAFNFFINGRHNGRVAFHVAPPPSRNQDVNA